VELTFEVVWHHCLERSTESSTNANTLQRPQWPAHTTNLTRRRSRTLWHGTVDRFTPGHNPCEPSPV